MKALLKGWGIVLMSKEILLKLENINKSYRNPSGRQEILKDFSLEIRKGELLVVMGESGLGKSTLLNIIGGLDVDFTGSREFFADSNQLIPFVFQEESNLLPWKTVSGNIKFVCPNIGSDELGEIVRLVKLEGSENKKPSELSGGMRQRLKLAMAIACKSSLILMDEPFTSLDEKLKHNMWELLKNIRKGLNLTIVLVTHDVSEADALADRIIKMS